MRTSRPTSKTSADYAVLSMPKHRTMNSEYQRWALITGGSKGIGRSIALEFASRGIHLILSSRTVNDLIAISKEIARMYPGIQVKYLSADVSLKEEVKQLGRFVREEIGQLDILVNNAGIFFPGEVLKEQEGNLEKMIQTNVYSAYYLTREVLALLLASPRAHIINMCSVASKMAYPNGGSYSISKFAMLGMSKAQRVELQETNVGVTAILPGATWSASWEGVDMPRNRLMESSNIAKVCYQVVSLEANATIEEIVIRPQKGDL